MRAASVAVFGTALALGACTGQQTLAWETGFPTLPWYGGPSYYDKWHGLPAGVAFPLSVWMQSPPNASRYQAVGINMFTGLWQGPTEDQLSGLSTAGLTAICDQAGVWQAHLGDPTIWGWIGTDGPDNAQQLPNGDYGPCSDPSTVIDAYDTVVKNDSTRPVYLGLGQGVADPSWYGRGSCVGDTSRYPKYAEGGDVLAFHVYPVNSGVPIETIATGMDNLLGWSNYAKPIISIVEASSVNGTARPTPDQIRAEVWISLIHGAAGIEYYCHRFKPDFSETDCLENAPAAGALVEINAQITSLADVLNTVALGDALQVRSSNGVPIDTRVIQAGGATYVFAVAMRGTATDGHFLLYGHSGTQSAEVLGESRSVPIVDGAFDDAFAGYAVHLYRVAP